MEFTKEEKTHRARAFAESVESRPSAYDEQVRAAAEVINALPDEWVDADKLREIADEMANWLLPPDITVQEERQLLVTLLDHFTDRVHNLLVDSAGAMTGGSRQVDVDTLREFISEWRTDCPAGDGPMILEQLEALLPAAPRTMDEIEWDDGEHQGLEAAYKAGTRWESVVRMICPMDNISGHGIVCVEKSGRGFSPYPGDLTPLSGTKINLTPTSTLDDEDDEPVFDPAYIYRDKDGDEWEHLDGEWITGDTHAKRVAERKIHSGLKTLPDHWDPYTRIEKEEANE